MCFYMNVNKWDKKMQVKLTCSKILLLTCQEQVFESFMEQTGSFKKLKFLFLSAT